MARLAFFGTPDFSLPSLRAVDRFCKKYGHEFSLVVSQVDRQQGRGKHVLPPPVKKLAVELGLMVSQPEKIRNDQFFEQFSGLHIDLAIVVAYGKIIPERILTLPPRGFVNVHASLLPRFRGAAPMQRAIEAGDHETGVCLMDVVKKLDEGDIFACQRTPILSYETSGMLFRRLASMGASLLSDNLDHLLHGRLKKIAQAEGVTYAHMLQKEEGLLNFSLAGWDICRKVLAFDPWPGAYGFIRKKRIKFFDSFFIHDQNIKKEAKPGTIVVVSQFLGVKTIDGIIYFQRIQVEGKRALSVKEALLGFPLSAGEQIGG